MILLVVLVWNSLRASRARSSERSRVRARSKGRSKVKIKIKKEWIIFKLLDVGGVMKSREDKILAYFKMWLTKDISGIEGIFEEDVFYSESYGPEYHGLEQVKKWFVDWSRHATVLEWNVKQFISQDKVTVAEWYFECDYDGVIYGFDGVSIIEFNEREKICSIKEFKSKEEHNSPYTKVDDSAL